MRGDSKRSELLALEVAPVKILGSAINITSKHSLEVSETVQDPARMWKDGRAAGTPAAPVTISETQGDRLTISKEALEAYRAEARLLGEPAPVSVDAEIFGLTPEDRILIMVLEKALGIQIKTPDDLKRAVTGAGKSIAAKVKEVMEAAEKQAEALKQAATPPDRAGWRYFYESSESPLEAENISIGIGAVVKTADGQEVPVQLQFKIPLSYASPSDGDAGSDRSLIVNYNGPAADLAHKSFIFDLDAGSAREGLRIRSRDAVAKPPSTRT